MKSRSVFVVDEREHMKRVVIVAMIAFIACAAVSAGDMQIGVAQNLLNTSFLFDAEFEYAGVEASVGLPAMWQGSPASGASEAAVTKTL